MKSEKDPAVLASTFTALQNFEEPEIAMDVTARYSDLPGASTGRGSIAGESIHVGRSICFRRSTTGLSQKEKISNSALRKMLMHGDDAIQSAIEKHWGEDRGFIARSGWSEIARLNTILSAGSGNPRAGKPLFMQNCGRCHLLFDEGGRIGPDLTPFARTNLERMLSSVVNPSLEIREGFENHVVITVDGRVLNGFLADKDSQYIHPSRCGRSEHHSEAG